MAVHGTPSVACYLSHPHAIIPPLLSSLLGPHYQCSRVTSCLASRSVWLVCSQLGRQKVIWGSSLSCSPWGRGGPGRADGLGAEAELGFDVELGGFNADSITGVLILGTASWSPPQKQLCLSSV